MKRYLNQCPMCKEYKSLEHCSLATIDRSVEGELQIFCCIKRAKKR
jgi:hypothetical protein